METKDILSVIAVLLSPLIAIQTEKFIARRRKSKSQKEEIFKSLMATRGSKLSAEHVYALNKIDLEFHNDKKYDKVINSWKEYFDILQTPWETKEQYAVWNSAVNELLVNLLFEMGSSLGYTFDRVLIRRNVYSPIGHAELENEERQIRQSLLKILNGEEALSVYPILSDETVERNEIQVSKQIEMQDAIIDQYKNPKPVNVKIVKD